MNTEQPSTEQPSTEHALAPASVQRAPAAPKAVKPLRISPKLRHAIELIETGECETQKAAAARAGISQEWLCKALGKSSIQAFIAERTRRTISTAGLAAAGGRLVQLIRASSEHVSLDASKHVLAIAGITPPDTRGPSVNINITPGYVIDLGGSSPVTIGAKPVDEA